MGIPSKKKIYFKNMSEAYAELCSGIAYLMSATPNIVPQDGIWYKTEFPTLKQTDNPGGRVDTVSLLSECLYLQLISFAFP
jgi:hypothetical protein